MASTLANLSPITVCGKVLPTPQLFQNIPMVHRMLEEVLEDWLRAVEPYQRQIDSVEGDSAKLSAVSSGLVELQPSLLKSLFSYAFFFAAADNAYAYFYRELNQANNLSGIRLGHRKPPTKTPYVLAAMALFVSSAASSAKLMPRPNGTVSYSGASGQSMIHSAFLLEKDEGPFGNYVNPLPLLRAPILRPAADGTSSYFSWDQEPCPGTTKESVQECLPFLDPASLKILLSELAA